MSRVSLETGTMDAFVPARAMYHAAGFVECAPFGDYTVNPHSVCMTPRAVSRLAADRPRLEIGRFGGIIDPRCVPISVLIPPSQSRFCVKFKKGETVIYPQHGACVVQGTKKMEFFGEKQEYLILKTVINEMTLKVPIDKTDDVGVRPPVSADELEDLVAVLAKPDPRVPSNWSRRFKNHQEKLKSGDVYQVAEVVRNLAARNRDASLSAAERTMYERARVNLISEISPALKVSAEEAEAYLDDALAKGVLKTPAEAKKK